MKKKIIIITVVLVIIVLVLVGKSLFNNANLNTKKPNTPDQSVDSNFLIKDFPKDKIPLYKLTKINSSHLFQNTDPKNTSPFNEKNFTYYNVVFETSASQTELLDYYQNLCDQKKIPTERKTEEIKGSIDDYKLTIQNYGDKTSYLQVYLPSTEIKLIDTYFTDFPANIIQASPLTIERERAFGLLNQKGGQREFTKYFTVLDSGDQNKDGQDDVDELSILINLYQKAFQEKTNYSYDNSTGIMKWQDQQLEITLTFSKNHSRLYLMIRKSF